MKKLIDYLREDQLYWSPLCGTCRINIYPSDSSTIQIIKNRTGIEIAYLNEDGKLDPEGEVMIFRDRDRKPIIPKKYWMSIYEDSELGLKGSKLYESKSEAFQYRRVTDYVTTIEIEI